MKDIVTEKIVLDASIALAWVFHDETNDAANVILEQSRRYHFVVPPIWKDEIHNTLIASERRGRSSLAQTRQCMDMLESLQVDIDIGALEAPFDHVLSLARTYHLTAYDACYLELALRMGAPIATLDSALKKAAEESGIGVVS